MSEAATAVLTADIQENRPTNQRATKAVSVRMQGELGEAINDIQRWTPAKTPSEVVRRALSVYHTLVAEKVKGNEPVLIKKSNDGDEHIPIFL